jgi:cell wall-associated NlpC family hydrolase
MMPKHHCLAIIALLVSLINIASAQKYTTYTVRKGDSLYTIAHRFNLRLGDVLRANNFADPHAIKPGVKLRIPLKSSGRAQAATGKKEKTTPRTVHQGWAELNKDRINVRSGPDTGSKRLTVVDRWTKVRVLGGQNGWSRVCFPDGRIGWVMSRYLDASGAPKQVAKAKPEPKAPEKPVATKQQPKAAPEPVAKQPVRTEQKAVVSKPEDVNRQEPVSDETEKHLAARFPRESRQVAATSEDQRDAQPNDSEEPNQIARTHPAVKLAVQYKGKPYHYGGTSSRGFDCSGFTSYIYARLGRKLPHNASAQSRLGRSVSRSELKQGDLVFFRTRGGSRVSHVGIYIGNNQFIHASSGRGRVRVDSLGSGYYSNRYLGARRVH